MKEISYDGPTFDENELRRRRERSRGSAEAPTVRTFRDDVNKMVEAEHLTKTQMVMAEAARREERGESRTLETGESHYGRIIFLLILVLAFGIGVGMYALIGTKKTPTEAAPKKPDHQASAEILLTGSPREQIMADISITVGKTNIAPGKTRMLAFTVKDANGGLHDASTAETLSALSLSSPPETLLNSLSEFPEYGVYAGKEGLIAYFQIDTLSYPETFAGMLEWERHLSDDLVPSINPSYARRDLADLRWKAFVDERLDGLDARVLRDESSRMVLAYTILDRKKLIITGQEEALDSIIRSLTPAAPTTE